MPPLHDGPPYPRTIVLGGNVHIAGEAKSEFLNEYHRLQRIAQLTANRAIAQKGIQEIDAELDRLTKPEQDLATY